MHPPRGPAVGRSDKGAHQTRLGVVGAGGMLHNKGRARGPSWAQMHHGLAAVKQQPCNARAAACLGYLGVVAAEFKRGKLLAQAGNQIIARRM